MYVTEYRKALRDAGFEGFRVMLFQQTGGLSQATGEDAGLDLDPPFFIALIKALACGDVLMALTYRVRPYEVEEGATDRALEASKRIVYDALLHKKSTFRALYRCRKLYEAVEVDRLRVRPKVSIIGEFWAMTTEGDGNYHLQRFIEQEKGENDIQLLTSWLLYNVWEAVRDTRERVGLRQADEASAGLAGLDGFGVGKRLAILRMADGALRACFHAFALPLGLYDYHLPDMDEIADIAHEHYDNDLRGGEGHMEVGKLILNVKKRKANMTLSVKPFGCMPSSGVSDGVQSIVQSRYPGSIYCPVETSGDGATNFYSRVLMYLYKARIAAEQDVERAYQEHGVTEAEVRAFLEKNPRYCSPLHHSPHVVACTAANLVHEVGPLLGQSRLKRATNAVRRGAAGLGELTAKLPAAGRAAYAFTADPENRARLREDGALVGDLLSGEAKERLMPLIERWSRRPEAVEG